MIKKIISIDLDGTLLNERKEITAKTIHVIENITNMGHIVVPCSGRALNDIPHVLRKNLTYFICSNGAIIWDEKNRNIMESYVLNKASVQSILNLIKDIDHVVTIVKNGMIFSEERIFETLFAEDKANGLEELFRKTRVIMKDIDNVISQKNIEKLHLNFFSKSQRDEAIRRINEITGCNVTFSDDFNLEISSEKATKGYALMWLMNKKGIEQKNVISIGDNNNDISMFQVSGLKVAMKNANKDLKIKADYITPLDNNNDGAAIFLEKYFE